MTDLEDEFAKLMAENNHVKTGRKVRTIRGGTPERVRMGVGDALPPADRPVQRKPVHSRPEKGPAIKVKSGPVARTSRGSTDREWGNAGTVEPFVPTPIPEGRYPKRFFPGELKRGDSVWYRGERYYVDYFPQRGWDVGGTFARITSICPRENQDQATFEHLIMQSGAMAFCVPVDALQKAPVVAKPYAKQPTKLAVDRRAEMKKAGVTDIGDEVAVLLRECDTLVSVYECASLYVGMSVKDLKAKYGHLNHGQQRMNLGNKMRNLLKKKGPK